jgi:hypothetical protein
MNKVKHKLVPYNDTLYDLLINNLKGKYFQNILFPALIIQIPEENRLSTHYIDNGKLSVWAPLENKWKDILLENFDKYAMINEEQFKEYQRNKENLSNILLAHKDSPIFKEITKLT